MTSLTNRIEEVHRELGRVLENPQSFGLGECLPKQFVDALTKMRRNLMDEWIDRKEPSLEHFQK
jgi:hypothetical protein